MRAKREQRFGHMTNREQGFALKSSNEEGNGLKKLEVKRDWDFPPIDTLKDGNQ